MSLAAGTRLGPYEILAPLGAGGMGEVYRARDRRLDREVAVKVLPEHMTRDPEALARFDREAKLVAALSHPGILAIYDVGAEKGIHYAVTELLEGETLRAHLDRSAFPWRKAVEVAVALAEALAAAHSKNVIHRDLKPENIFLTTDGRVKILDFGLARQHSEKDDLATVTGMATEPGTVMGTAGYMAPEQVRGARGDPASDIFSFGCVLYEIVAGRRAFAKATAAETMTAILREEPPELPSSRKHIPPDLERLIGHCLEKNPEARFHSAHDLTYGLKALLTPSTSSRIARGPRHRKGIDSLAVLPFANLGGDPATDHLVDGITDSLINRLSQSPKLRVVARSRVFRYKGRQVDPLRVARDLKVRALLTGRVIQRGDMLSIQAELEDMAEEKQLWGQHYNRRVADLFAVQEEIANEIMTALRQRLPGEEKRRAPKRRAENTEARRLYLKGRHWWAKRAPDAQRKAIQCYEQAIEKDPGYAPAYAGMADSLSLLGLYGALPPKDVFPPVKVAARKALDLDDRIAEAHTSLAFARAFYDWEWADAQQELETAIKLNPEYALAHYWRALCFFAMRQFDEGLHEAKQAQELDPLSAVLGTAVSFGYRLLGRHAEGVAELRKTLELHPDFFLAHYYLGIICVQLGRNEEAMEACRRAVSLSEGNSLPMAGLGYVYAASGRREEAEKVLEQLTDLAGRRYVSADFIAVVHMGLGNKDAAAEWLTRAYQERSVSLAWSSSDPVFDGVRNDPRYQSIRRRMALPL